MATPPLPSNPSIDNPPLTPEPIRQDPEPDVHDEPDDDWINPESTPRKVYERRETGLRSENPSCQPPF